MNFIFIAFSFTAEQNETSIFVWPIVNNRESL